MIQTSVTDEPQYKSVCLESYNDDSKFEVFKRNQTYNQVLEHVNKDQGQHYLNNINQNFDDFKNHLDKFKINDIYGGSNKESYSDVGEISPSTLRYIKVLSDLKNLFGDLTNKKIVEIGVGYGGQCCIINSYYTPNEYSLIDLDEVLLLSDKYLNKLNINHKIINIKDLESIDEEFDLVISNYAYSELTKETQDFYYEKIIKKSKNAYITLNFISHYFNIESYSLDDLLKIMSDKNPKILDETPKTAEGNVILYF